MACCLKKVAETIPVPVITHFAMGIFGFSYQEMISVGLCHSSYSDWLFHSFWHITCSGRRMCLKRPSMLQVVGLECCPATLWISQGYLARWWEMFGSETPIVPADRYPNTRHVPYPTGASPQAYCHLTADAWRSSDEINQAWHRFAELLSAQSTHTFVNNVKMFSFVNPSSFGMMVHPVL